jgi:hypothetical protein
MGLLTIGFFFLKLQSCHLWGDLSDEMSGLSCVSLVFEVYSSTGVFTLAVKRPRREADHSSPTIAEIKKTWIYTMTCFGCAVNCKTKPNSMV